MYCHYFLMEEIVKILCHVFGTVNICWLNCVISVQNLVNHTKNSFLVTCEPLDIIIIILRLDSGKDVSNIQSSQLKYFIVNRQASFNPQAFIISSMSLLYKGSRAVYGICFDLRGVYFSTKAITELNWVISKC